MQNETIRTQLNHCSIRAFTDRPVADDVIQTLFDVINRTASSCNMQQFGVIRVRDDERKRKIADVCEQHYVYTSTELFIFYVDMYRIMRIAKQRGFAGESYRDMDKFFQGFTDACLSAQNMTAALESLGLGGVYLGSILNDQEKIIEILELPELTFPVVGIGFGYPAETHVLKPRMPVELKYFENRYQIFDDYLDAIAGYDRQTVAYYQEREGGGRSESFSDQVIARLELELTNRSRIVNVIRKQGFNLMLD